MSSGIRVVQETDENGGDGIKARYLMVYNGTHNFIHIKTRKEHQSSTTGKVRVHDMALGKNVIEGQKANPFIIRNHPLVKGYILCAVEEVPMGQHGPFGSACRTACIKDRCRVISRCVTFGRLFECTLSLQDSLKRLVFFHD